jgi:hypothetical protein
MEKNGHTESELQTQMVGNERLPQVTWQRKLNSKVKNPSEFKMSIRDVLHLFPLGYRLWRYTKEEAKKGRFSMYDIFKKRHVRGDHGVPLGGIGGGSIGRSLNLSVVRFYSFQALAHGGDLLLLTAKTISISLIFLLRQVSLCNFFLLPPDSSSFLYHLANPSIKLNKISWRKQLLLLPRLVPKFQDPVHLEMRLATNLKRMPPASQLLILLLRNAVVVDRQRLNLTLPKSVPFLRRRVLNQVVVRKET